MNILMDHLLSNLLDKRSHSPWVPELVAKVHGLCVGGSVSLCYRCCSRRTEPLLHKAFQTHVLNFHLQSASV